MPVKDIADILTVAALTCHPKAIDLRQVRTGWARSDAYAIIGAR